VLFRRLAGGGVIVDLDGDRIFELNDTGARIWECLQAGQSVAMLPAILSNEFDVDANAAAAEVRRLIAELQAAGLLER